MLSSVPDPVRPFHSQDVASQLSRRRGEGAGSLVHRGGYHPIHSGTGCAGGVGVGGWRAGGVSVEEMAEWVWWGGVEGIHG